MVIVKAFDIPKQLIGYKLPIKIFNHCDKYKKIHDRQASLFAWRCLSKYINLNDVVFDKNGKPIVLHKKRYISLSHSCNKVAIAISNNPIGIDIERLIPIEMASKLANRFLSEKEYQQYLRSTNKSLWFTKYWTKKEALMKLDLNDTSFKLITKQVKDKSKQRYVMACLVANKKRG